MGMVIAFLCVVLMAACVAGVGLVFYVYFWDSLRDFFRPIMTSEMYKIGVDLGDNAEAIHEVVDRWEHERDALMRETILEPLMRMLFAHRVALKNQIEILRTSEKLRRELLALSA